jgi:hypothetical protein
MGAQEDGRGNGRSRSVTLEDLGERRALGKKKARRFLPGLFRWS